MNVTLFHVRGIPVRLHWSFLLLAGFFVLRDLVSGGVVAAASAAGLGVALFGSVLLHELGHATAARRFGISTRDITLYPFGGVASLEEEPRSAKAELVVAIAGPLVNVALAAIAFPLLVMGLPGAGLFFGLNVGMALFNLLPAFPMDGGRVLRAWLVSRQGYLTGTDRAIRVGRWFAWGFLALGLLGGEASLALVGGFLLLATGAERQRLALLVRHLGGRGGGGGGGPRPVRWEPPRREVLGSSNWSHPAV